MALTPDLPERLPGESIAGSYARSMGLTLDAAVEFWRGCLRVGIPFSKATQTDEMAAQYIGLAALLVLAEKDLQACPSGQDGARFSGS